MWWGNSGDDSAEAVGTSEISGAGSSTEQAPLPRIQEGIYTIDLVKTLTPSVVQVVTEFQAMGTFNRPGPGVGVGTGVILDLEGNILTNNYVIAGAERITVTLNNGNSFTARLVGGDAATDTAVIRIKANGLQPAKLGRSSELRVGEQVVGIGHALGLPGGPTVSKGVVSALGRSIDIDPRTTMLDLIQTDAAINPGNSGGPLVNSRSEVIGINTAVIQGSQGIGFAINIDDAKIVVDQLMENGYVDRGVLGISPITLPSVLAFQLGAPVTEGVLVVQVFAGSGADNAGLQAEDIIVQMGEEPIRNTGELSKFLLGQPAEPVPPTVLLVGARGQNQAVLQVDAIALEQAHSYELASQQLLAVRGASAVDPLVGHRGAEGRKTPLALIFLRDHIGVGHEHQAGLPGMTL